MAASKRIDLAGRLPDVRWGLLPILLVPVVISFWPSATPLRSEAETIEVAPDSADYYLRGAKMSSLDDDGRLLYQFRADEVLHYPDESAHITQLELEYLGPEGHWNIKAPIGIVPTGLNELQLSGGVLIQGRSEKTSPLTTITMDDARLLPDTRQLDTDSEIRMDDSGRKVRAVGMIMDIDKDIVKLKHQVRVNHAPQ